MIWPSDHKVHEPQLLQETQSQHVRVKYTVWNNWNWSETTAVRRHELRHSDPLDNVTRVNMFWVCCHSHVLKQVSNEAIKNAHSPNLCGVQLSHLVARELQYCSSVSGRTGEPGCLPWWGCLHIKAEREDFAAWWLTELLKTQVTFRSGERSFTRQYIY